MTAAARSAAAAAARPATAAGPASTGSAAAAGLIEPGCAFAPHGGRGCGDRGQIDGFDGGAWNLVSDVALDVRQRDGIFLAAETDGIAVGAGTRGAPDPMHIILGIVRQIEIEHMA